MSAVYLTVEGSTPDASDATFATGACQHGSGVGVEFESADAMVQHLRRLPGPFVTFDGTRYGWRVLAKSVTQAEDAAWCKCQAVHHGHKDFGLAFALEFGYETDLCSLCDAAPRPPHSIGHARSGARQVSGQGPFVPKAGERDGVCAGVDVATCKWGPKQPVRRGDVRAVSGRPIVDGHPPPTCA